MANYFRRGGFPSGVLNARKKFYDEYVKGGSNKNLFLAQNRVPAYCYIPGPKELCKTIGNALNEDAPDFWEEYIYNEHGQPYLKSATVTIGGDYGLTTDIEVEILCFSKTQFEKVAGMYFKAGADIAISFGYTDMSEPKPGYANHRGGVGGGKVVSWGVSLTPEGWYILSVKAVAPHVITRALNVLDCNIDKNLEYEALIAGEDEQYDMFKVTNIPQLITHYANRIAGGTALSRANMDAEKIEFDEKGTSTGFYISNDFITGIEEKTDKKEQETAGVWSKILKFFGVNDATGLSTFSHYNDGYVYIPLITIVEFINRYVLQNSYSKVNSKFTGRIKFGSNELKVNKMVTSAYPLNILLIDGSIMGKYGKGDKIVDFEELGKKFKLKNSVNGVIVDPKHIYIERQVISSAMNYTHKEKVSADTNNPKLTPNEDSVDINSFFSKIFNSIRTASGGSIDLILTGNIAGLVEIAENSEGEINNQDIYIVAQNEYHNQPIKAYSFNGIEGDGSTKNISISTSGGSVDYKGAIFSGLHSSGDPIHAKNNVDAQAKHDEKYKKSMDDLFEAKFSIVAAGFGNDECKAIESALRGINNHQPNRASYIDPIYIGMSCTVTYEGAWGAAPGHAFWVTHLPKPNPNTHFRVKEVTHTFSGDESSWTTAVSGFLAI